MEKKTGTRFRSWIVSRLAESRFATYVDDTDEEIAARLGVRVDVLEEARALFKERMKAHPLVSERGRFGNKTVYEEEPIFECFLEPPQEIYEAWSTIRDARRTNDSSLFRGVVHAVLRVETQPEWLGRRLRNSWVWEGKWIGQENSREHRYRLACKISEGAYRALHARALATRSQPSSITRWGVNLFVCGKLQAQVVTSPWSMYKDEARYCTKPRITKIT